jgi:hypothetical protein
LKTAHGGFDRWWKKRVIGSGWDEANGMFKARKKAPNFGRDPGSPQPGLLPEEKEKGPQPKARYCIPSSLNLSE